MGVDVKTGSTDIRTRIAGFKVQSANHYTIEPLNVRNNFLGFLKRSLVPWVQSKL